MEHRELLAGLVRLHVLHHAVEGEAIYGRSMIEELGRHGYRLSPGTLYPMLHSLERRGYLISTRQRLGRTFRRVYRATPLGHAAMTLARAKVRELFDEIGAGAAGNQAPTSRSR
jgi:DNA-binding PadR family transcriptional regulator